MSKGRSIFGIRPHKMYNYPYSSETETDDYSSRLDTIIVIIVWMDGLPVLYKYNLAFTTNATRAF